MGRDEASAEMRAFLIDVMADDIWTESLVLDVDLPAGVAVKLAVAAYDAIPEEISQRMSAPPPEGANAAVLEGPSHQVATVDLVAEVLRRAPLCPTDRIPMLGIAAAWHFCTVCGRSQDFPEDLADHVAGSST